MWIVTKRALRDFWENAKNKKAEQPLLAWHKRVKAAQWCNFADVKRTYHTADRVGNKIVFDVGGNKYRVITVIDFVGHRVFIRAVLNHADYDKGNWKDDTFGDDWDT